MRRRAARPEAVSADIDTAALEQALGHRFDDRALLVQALTHPSAPRAGAGPHGYERLEFLGDRVLGLAIADLLQARFPRETEGALSKRLAALVRREAVAEVGRALDLAPLIRLPPTEEPGTRTSVSTLADAGEAVLGALYLDAGFTVARAAIERLWAEAIAAAAVPPKDPKTALQEWLQGRGLALPEYKLAGSEGPAHQPLFRVRVEAETGAAAEATGATKRAAEAEAAALLLAALEAGRA